MLKRFLLSITILSLLISLVFPYMQVRAAVPVYVVGFDAATDFERNLEKFMFDLFHTLQKREEDFETSFELQKAEKAREDVNKLIYEVRQELQDQGEIIDVVDPASGAEHKIMKEGRMITNVDDFLYEEPLEKARDFVYCYFGDWKFFPFADTPGSSAEQDCFVVWTDPISGTDAHRYPDDQCDSNRERERLEDEIIAQLIRKGSNFIFSPPESWYTKRVCSMITANTLTLVGGESGPGSGSYSTLRQSLLGIVQDGRYWTWDEFLQSKNPNNSYDATYNKVVNTARQIIDDYQKMRYAQYIAGQGLRSEKYWVNIPIDPAFPAGLVFPYETEYVISPAAILLQKMQAATQAEFDLAQKSFLDLRWLVELAEEPDPANPGEKKGPFYSGPETGGVTIAEILAGYNLTANLLDDNPFTPEIDPSPRFWDRFIGGDDPYIDGGPTSTWTILSPWLIPNTDTLEFGSAVLPSQVVGGSREMREISGGLPAPWEDDSSYTTLPEAYYNANQRYGTDPTAGAPDKLGNVVTLDPYTGYRDFDKFLNQWYKDIFELYQYNYPLSAGGVPAPLAKPSLFSRLLEEFFKKPDHTQDWNWYINWFLCPGDPPDVCIQDIINYKFP